MKKVFTAATALALLGVSATAVLAQEGRWGGGRGGDRGDRGGGQAQAAPEAQPQAQQQPAPEQRFRPRFRGDGDPSQNRPQQAAPAPQPAPQAAPAPQQQQRYGEAQRRDDRGRADNNDRGRYDRGGRDERRDWNDNDRARNWNDGRDRNWNDRDRNWNDNRRVERPRYDRRNYPSVYRLDRRFNGPRYRPPSGFYVRSWGYGDILPRTWYGPQYRIDDWWSYDLPIPPIGYDWVRVGDDVLLVDTFTGRVVQVIYDAFW
jgi:Ni/Co efflux regulator RcnB